MRLHSGLDIALLDEMCVLLKPFKDVTQILTTEKSSSISLLRPLLNQLLEHVKPQVDVNTPIIHQTKALIHHDLETR